MTTGPVEFEVIERKRADTLRTEKRAEQRWATVVRTLQTGEDVFVPNMTRNMLESLRTITNYRGAGVLHSASVTIDGVPGKMLRLGRRVRKAERDAHS